VGIKKLKKTATNKGIANSGARGWSNQQSIAISFGSSGRNFFKP